MSEGHGRDAGQYDDPPEWFKRSQVRTGPERFLDGCHRYNWIISPILSAAISLAMFSYFIGGVKSEIEDLRADVQLLKQQVFSLARPLKEAGNDNQHR